MESANQAQLIWAAAQFAGGLAVLLIAARYFIDGVALFAEVFGVPPLVVGMTVVAFGTSTPELVVNSLSAYRGDTGLAFGNVVGSCSVNIGVVLAVTALVRPLRVEPSIITREIPMLLVGVTALLIFSHDRLFEHAANDAFGREDGLVLLLLFTIFIYYTAIYSIARRKLGIRPDAFMETVAAEAEPKSRRSLLRQGIVTLICLAGITIGAEWTVSGATSIALLAGVRQNIIGLTIVSLGTTLPEMVTCLMAARRGNADIALGNVVGSNLFNLLAIGGVVSVIRAVPVPPGGHMDLLVMALLTGVLLPIAIRSGRTITRGEGAFLLAVYLAFLGYRLWTL